MSIFKKKPKNKPKPKIFQSGRTKGTVRNRQRRRPPR